MNTVKVAPSTTRKFPYPSLLAKYYEKTPEQRSRSRAEYGIRQAEYRIGYETEQKALYASSGPLEGEGMELDRLDSMQLCQDQIAINTREIARLRKVLASLPAQA